MKKADGNGVFFTYLLCTGDMAGAGILSLPAAIAIVGLGPGCLMIVLSCLVTMYTGITLGRVAVETGVIGDDETTSLINEVDPVIEKKVFGSAYSRIAYATLGWPGWLVVLLGQTLTLFGVVVVFLLLSAMNMEIVVGSVIDKEVSISVWIAGAATVTMPFLFFGDSSKHFWWTGLLTVVSVVVASAVIVGLLSEERPIVPAPIQVPKTPTYFQSFGAVAFSFGGLSVFPAVQSGMKNPRDFWKSVLLTDFHVVILYLIVGGSAVSWYGEKATGGGGNLLGLLNPNNVVVRVVSALIVIHLIAVIVTVMAPISETMSSAFSVKRRWIKSMLRVLLLVLAMTLAIVAQKHFFPVLSFLGGFFISLLSFLMPGLMSLALAWPRASLRKILLSTAVIVVGLIAGFGSIWSAVYSVTSKH